MKQKSQRVLRYREFSDDLVENPGQARRLPADYQWVREKKRPVLFLLGRVWARLYRWWTGTSYVNAQILQVEGACFIYGNHTQPIGDILAPLDYCPRRPRLLASPANLGLPIIGRLLPDLGALPVPDNISGLAKLEAAVAHYAREGAPIIIYPEAHVWPYYTGVRPLPSAAFAYAVKNQAAVFSATTTYQKRRWRRKPRRTIYFSGPFCPDAGLPRRERAKKLRDQVAGAMGEAVKKNEVEYVRYEKE